MKLTKLLILCGFFVFLANCNPRRLIVENEQNANYTQNIAPQQNMPENKNFVKNFIESLDGAWILLTDSFSHTLRQIEYFYHIPYPYSMGILIGFCLFAVFITSRILSLFLHKKVFLYTCSFFIDQGNI